MILIEEKKPNKVPGPTSFFITMNYNKNVVENIKRCGMAIYDKTSNVWEIPATSLADFVNSIYQYDDITIKVLDQKQKKHKTVECEKDSFKTTPYYYQIDGINYGLNHDKWLLLDQPGLGKSLSAIYIAQERKRLENIEHCLIICGVNALKSNWKQEIQRHSNLSCRILGEKTDKKGNVKIGSVKERIEQLKNKIDEFFVITNVETIRDNDIVKYINKGPNKFDMIVVDEVHTCLTGDQLIDTDEGLIPIKDIVENGFRPKIKSMGKKVQYKQAVGASKTAFLGTLLELSIEDESGNEHTIKCTKSHLIRTRNRGYVQAQFLTEDDDIILD